MGEQADVAEVLARVRALLAGRLGIDPGEVSSALSPLVRALAGRAGGHGGDADAESALERLLGRTSDPEAARIREEADAVSREVADAQKRRRQARAVAAVVAAAARVLVVKALSGA